MPGSWVRILAELDTEDSFLFGTLENSNFPGDTSFLLTSLEKKANKLPGNTEC
jgi:hypothetical protein